MGLIILRVVFVLVAAGVGVQLINSDVLLRDPPYIPWLVFGGVLLLAVGVIASDSLIRRKRIDTISAVYLGLIVGLFLTYVLRLALSPMLPADSPGATYLELILGTILCYTCISLLLADQG